MDWGGDTILAYIEIHIKKHDDRVLSDREEC